MKKVISKKGKLCYRYTAKELVKVLELVNQIDDKQLRLSLISKLGVQ